MDEYLSNSTYTKITYPYSEIKNRLKAFTKKIKFHVSSSNLPHLFIATKFHKNNFKFRRVICATNKFSCYAGIFFLIYYVKF